ncbi:hypothetical protein RUM43_009055 [Polyplax serrata]|uniref:Uncharacterized protein n=1 Tax=Polyplax serrata TaxID=468196 RepID=A0AAN8PA80_POLSC
MYNIKKVVFLHNETVYRSISHVGNLPGGFPSQVSGIRPRKKNKNKNGGYRWVLIWKTLGKIREEEEEAKRDGAVKIIKGAEEEFDDDDEEEEEGEIIITITPWYGVIPFFTGACNHSPARNTPGDSITVL